MRHTHSDQLRLFAVGPHRDGGMLQALRPPSCGAADVRRRQADPAPGFFSWTLALALQDLVAH
jgi:hypothetical protein